MADRGDRIAFFDEPLDHDAAVRGLHLERVAQALHDRHGLAGLDGIAALARLLLAAGEDALHRRDEQPPGRRGVDLGRAAVLLDERAGVVQLVRRLEGEGLDALERALRDTGQRARRRHLEDAGDVEVGHRLHAQVPADRRADLLDQALQDLAAVVHDLAVAVRDQARARVVRGDGLRVVAEDLDRGLHVLGVEGAGDRQRDQPRFGRAVLCEGGELLDRTRCDDLAGAVVVRGDQAVLGDLGQHLVAVATEHRCHRGGCMLRGGGHRLTALADQHHRLLRAQHADTDGGGDLTDAVTGGRAHRAEGVGRVREHRQGGEQAGRDQQWLRDRGVADRLRVGLRAVVGEVDSGDRGQPVEPAGEGGIFQPRFEESWGLGALTRRDDDEHVTTLPEPGASWVWDAHEFCRAVFVTILQNVATRVGCQQSAEG